MHRIRWLTLLVAGLLLSSGCITSRMTGARSQFAQDVTCPANRVAVRRAPLIMPAATPPADVAGDRQRLAMWEQKDAERIREKQSETYYVATGCGQSRVYHCYYCVEMPGETDCGMAPNCDADASCRESRSRPGSIVCDGTM